MSPASPCGVATWVLPPSEHRSSRAGGSQGCWPEPGWAPSTGSPIITRCLSPPSATSDPDSRAVTLPKCRMVQTDTRVIQKGDKRGGLTHASGGGRLSCGLICRAATSAGPGPPRRSCCARSILEMGQLRPWAQAVSGGAEIYSGAHSEGSLPRACVHCPCVCLSGSRSPVWRWVTWAQDCHGAFVGPDTPPA